MNTLAILIVVSNTVLVVPMPSLDACLRTAIEVKNSIPIIARCVDTRNPRDPEFGEIPRHLLPGEQEILVPRREGEK